MAKQVPVLSSTVIYDGRVLGLKVDRVIEPGGVEAIRELVTHVGSVVVLPVLDDGRTVLVRQFRYATRKSLWELVAGSLEPGETARSAARRELREETGYLARRVHPVFSFYPSPGFLTERMHLLLAQGLIEGEAHPESDERIQVGRFTRPELRRMLRAGKIEDGKTLVGLLWLLSSARRRSPR